MSPATETGSDALQINLAAAPGWTFAAGDTIIGEVVRNSHLIATDARITLTLIGHLETEISSDHGFNHGRKYRSDWQLWTPIHQDIFQGPLHIPKPNDGPGAMSWPFSVTLPKYCDASVACGHSNKESFLPLEMNMNNALPGSFYSAYHGPGTSYEAAVEYYLQAELHFVSREVPRAIRAVRSITVKYPLAPPQTQWDQIETFALTQQIPSKQIHSRSEHKITTIIPKLRNHIRPSVPWNYTLEVTLPRCIRLNHPTPFPLVFQLVPQTDGKISIPEARLDWVKMTIQSQIQFSARSRARVQTADHFYAHYLHLEKAFKSLGVPIMLSVDNRYEPADLGHIFGLTLDSDGLRVQGKQLVACSEIHPDFVSYNIKYENSLELRFSVTVAGKSRTIDQKVPLKILPR